MSDSPLTDSALDASYTYEEKLAEVAALCRDLEMAIRAFARGIPHASHHPEALAKLIRLANPGPPPPRWCPHGIPASHWCADCYGEVDKQNERAQP